MLGVSKNPFSLTGVAFGRPGAQKQLPVSHLCFVRDWLLKEVGYVRAA